MSHFKNVVIFGGSGFIGSHLAVHLLKNQLADQIFLADIESPKFENLPPELQTFGDRFKYVKIDVRNSISEQNKNGQLPTQVDLIVNLAAVHREPGHERNEYYDTNIPGAENISDWAREINCERIVFTSSIAVYGTLKIEPKTERTPPQPNTPYGVSKLAAEQIHQDWASESANRKLLIVRPGVIFGTGEAGNITRMVRGIRNHYFVFFGNQNVKKSGGYIKELCNSITWMMNYQDQQNIRVLLYNFTMHPAATVSEIAKSISQELGGNKKIWSIPYGLLLPTATIIGRVAKFFGIDQPINRARVEKLLRINDIVAEKLVETGYKYQYTLDSAFADWHIEHPQDWS